MPTAELIDWRKALASRKGSKPGMMRRYASKSALLDSVELPDVATNPDEWSATAIISTPTPDRSNDIVHPEGCDLENYRRNPVVFYDHGFSGVHFPVGISETPDGQCTVVVTDKNIEAKTFFDREIEESRQIFKLIQARFIRTTSIGFEPIEVQLRKGFQVDQFGNGPLEVFLWELLEYSWTNLPCNPEATRKLLDLRKIDDEPLTGLILKSLEPFAAPVPIQGRGITLETKAVTKKITKSDSTPDGDVVDETVDTNSETTPEAETPDEPKEQPLGMQVMAAVIAGLNTLKTQIESAMGPLENPAVKEYLGNLSAALAGCESEAQSAYKDSYGSDYTPDESSDDDQTVSKFLAQHLTSRLTVSGLAKRLDGLKSAKNLTAVQKAEVAAIQQRLTKLHAESRKSIQKQPAQSTIDAKEAAELAEAKKELAAVAKRFNDLLPAR